MIPSELKSVLTPATATASETIRELRRELAGMYGFLQGESVLEDYVAFDLDRAMAERIEEIEGTPLRNPRRPNKLDTLNHMLQHVDKVLAAAIALDADDLSDEVVAGFGGVSSYLDGIRALVDDRFVPSEVADSFGGSIPTYGQVIPGLDDVA